MNPENNRTPMPPNKSRSENPSSKAAIIQKINTSRHTGRNRPRKLKSMSESCTKIVSPTKTNMVIPAATATVAPIPFVLYTAQHVPTMLPMQSVNAHSK